MTIFDEVVVPGSEAERWFGEWRDHYLPPALERGLELRRAFRGFTEDPDEVLFILEWSVPTVGAFFAVRGRATADDSVAAFWARTDRVAVRRNRRVVAEAAVG